MSGMGLRVLAWILFTLIGAVWLVGKTQDALFERALSWAQRGIWKGIFDALAKECDDALIFIDASIVRAHRAASGSKRGSYKKLLAAHAEVARAKFTLL